MLKGILSEESFQHFMSLHVTARLLCTKDCSPEHVSYTDQLLNYFVEKASAPVLYGETVNVYNVHGPVNLAEDVCKLGCLDSFSSFPFENYLGSIKKNSIQKTGHWHKFLKEWLRCQVQNDKKEKRRRAPWGTLQGTGPTNI